MGMGREVKSGHSRNRTAGWRLRSGVLLLLFIALLSGCASMSSSSSDSSKEGAGDVLIQQVERMQGYGQNWPDIRSVDLLTPLPLPHTYRSLQEQSDGPRLALLQTWLNASTAVEDASLTAPLNDRSFGLRLILANDTEAVVRPAWTCTRNGDDGKDSLQSVQCTTVEAHVTVELEDGSRYFAQSESLFRLLDTPALLNEWLPMLSDD